MTENDKKTMTTTTKTTSDNVGSFLQTSKPCFYLDKILFYVIILQFLGNIREHVLCAGELHAYSFPTYMCKVDLSVPKGLKTNCLIQSF